MKIKGLIFDLDGVLVDTKKIHFDALNIALKSIKFEQISFKDHVNIYDGLPTLEKLKILSYFDKCLKEKKKTDISVLNKLIITFSCHEFAQVYSRQLLVAFKLDAKKKRYKNWSELINYCKYSANPVGRFFINLAYHERKKKINCIFLMVFCSTKNSLSLIKKDQENYLVFYIFS